MRFDRYSRGVVVAHAIDDGIVLRRPSGVGLLRTLDGIPYAWVDLADVADVAAILECVAGDLDRDECARRGVEVEGR